MLGEGMPWHIILVCMVLGILLGINSGKKDERKDGIQDTEEDS